MARSQAEDFQLVLVRYGLERLLYRLSLSPYREAFVLKGAMLFQLWSREPHRATRDVDFLCRGEISVERYEKVFRGLVAALGPGDAATARALRLLLLGALNWVPHWYRPGRDSPRAIARRFTRLLAQGETP